MKVAVLVILDIQPTIDDLDDIDNAEYAESGKQAVSNALDHARNNGFDHELDALTAITVESVTGVPVSPY